MMTPAGWYDDGTGQLRYWDGQGWTQHVALAGGQPPVSAASEQAPAAAVAALGSEHTGTGGFAEPGVDVYGGQHAAVYATSPVALAPGAPLKTSRLGLWVTLGLVGVLVLVGGAIAAIVLVARAATVTPEDQLAALVQTWRAEDCPAEYALMHPYITEGMTTAEYCDGVDYEWFAEMEGWDYTVVDSEVDGATAYVTTTESYTWEGDPYTEQWTYEFRQVDGRWFYYDATT